MKTIQILDEYDMRAEVNNVLSCAYEGDDWMEDGSIRQDIKNLQNLIDNNLSVLAQHDVKLLSLADKIDSAVVCIQTLNKMVEILSKHVEIPDESE